MGTIDDLILDGISLGIQMVYFKMKNNRRARVLRPMAEKHQLKFWQKPSEYHGELDRIDPPVNPEADNTSVDRVNPKARLARSSKAKLALQLFGESQLQARLWAFKTNRWRGDWQTNCNILEGSWKGHLMTSFDTLYFKVDDPSTEGEYSSVFAHCGATVPSMIISPAGLLAGLKRVDENQVLNWGYHKVSFELADFNKRYRVVSTDNKLAFAFISQAMIEYLMDHTKEKWHIELAPGGILISTISTLTPKGTEQAMDFLAGFLEHVDEDLLKS